MYIWLRNSVYVEISVHVLSEYGSVRYEVGWGVVQSLDNFDGGRVPN